MKYLCTIAYRCAGIFAIVLLTVLSNYRIELFGSEPACLGGLSSRQENRTGWFHLAKKHGRDLLITPNGKEFFAFGVNHIKDMRDTSHFKSLSEKESTSEVAVWERILNDYRAWGFNMCGYGAPTQVHSKMPYVLDCTAARTSKFFSEPDVPGGNTASHSRGAWEFPDVWSEMWQSQAEKAIGEMCSNQKDRTHLIGYFWTDTPTWDVIKTRGLRGTDWVSTIRRLNRDAPGKQRYIKFLREKYENRLDDFRDFYNLKESRIDDLLDHDFKSLPIGRHRVIEDDRKFLGMIAMQYYQTLSRIQRKHDSHHLCFGERFLAGDTPDEVLAAAGDCVDVISVQPGDGYTDLYLPSDPFPAEELERIHKITGKPLLICDHQISFPTSEYQATTWTQLADETVAATATERFILDAFAKPYIIGYMRCQYIDRPAGLGRGMKQGILRDNGDPHPKLLEAHRRASKVIRNELSESE